MSLSKFTRPNFRLQWKPTDTAWQPRPCGRSKLVSFRHFLMTNGINPWPKKVHRSSVSVRNVLREFATSSSCPATEKRVKRCKNLPHISSDSITWLFLTIQIKYVAMSPFPVFHRRNLRSTDPESTQIGKSVCRACGS